MTRVIAIDGPAASGKSSTARGVAEALGVAHLDSGALYRGLALIALELAAEREGGAVEDVAPGAVIAAAEHRGFELRSDGVSFIAWLDGLPAEERIRTPAVTRAVSPVSAVAPLRDWVNARLRGVVAAGPVAVVDGRDIGTIVFPEAGLKVFLTATPEERARRRLTQRGQGADEAALAREAAVLAARDRADSTRAVAPLKRAPDALVLDTTGMTLAEQVSWIVGQARRRGIV
ncbi:MAG: (d)CMP kinase [Gemmatimonadales bacterium]